MPIVRYIRQTCVAALLAAGAALALTLLLAPSPAAAQTCPYNSTQGTCACPTSGPGVTCVGGQLYNPSTQSCYDDPRPCASNQVMNCDTGQCACNTSLYPCGGCTAPTSTPGDPAPSPVNGVYTNQCGGTGCPSGTQLCSSSTTCVTVLSCPEGTSFDPCTNSCGTPNVLLSPSWDQSGDIRITGDITTTTGDLYMANGKSIRVDGVGTTLLNVGNWTGDDVNLKVFGDLIGTGISTIAGDVDVGADSIETSLLCFGDGVNCRGSWPVAGDYSAAFVDNSGSESMSGPLTIDGSGTNLRLEGGGTTGPKMRIAAPSGMEGLRIVSSTDTEPFVVRNNGDTATLFSVDENGILSAGNVPWARLSSFPAACPAGQYVTAVGGTLTCAAPSGPTGSGTANQVAYWSDGSTLASDPGLYWNPTSDRLGIGATPSYTLDVGDDARVSGQLGVGTTPSSGYGINVSHATTGIRTDGGSNYGIHSSGGWAGIYTQGGYYGVYGSGTSSGLYGTGPQYGVWAQGGAAGLYFQNTDSLTTWGRLGYEISGSYHGANIACGSGTGTSCTAGVLYNGAGGTTARLAGYDGTTPYAAKFEGDTIFDGSVSGDQSGAVRVSTGNGYVDVGPKDASYSHFYTDRPSYYFDTEIQVDTGRIGSFDENLSLETSGTTRMTIETGGDVGIGTTNPTYKLHVNDSGDALYVGNSSSWFDLWTGGNTRIGLGYGGSEAGYIATDNNAAGENNLIITACQDGGSCPGGLYANEAGRIGIGNDDPSQTLDVNGSVDINNYELYFDTSSTSRDGIGFNAEGGTQVTIFSDDIISFTESDGDTLRAYWSMNNATFDFNGRVIADSITLGGSTKSSWPSLDVTTVTDYFYTSEGSGWKYVSCPSGYQAVGTSGYNCESNGGDWECSSTRLYDSQAAYYYDANGTAYTWTRCARVN